MKMASFKTYLVITAIILNCISTVFTLQRTCKEKLIGIFIEKEWITRAIWDQIPEMEDYYLKEQTGINKYAQYLRSKLVYDESVLSMAAWCKTIEGPSSYEHFLRNDALHPWMLPIIHLKVKRMSPEEFDLILKPSRPDENSKVVEISDNRNQKKGVKKSILGLMNGLGKRGKKSELGETSGQQLLENERRPLLGVIDDSNKPAEKSKRVESSIKRIPIDAEKERMESIAFYQQIQDEYLYGQFLKYLRETSTVLINYRLLIADWCKTNHPLTCKELMLLDTNLSSDTGELKSMEDIKENLLNLDESVTMNDVVRRYAKYLKSPTTQNDMKKVLGPIEFCEKVEVLCIENIRMAGYNTNSLADPPVGNHNLCHAQNLISFIEKYYVEYKRDERNPANIHPEGYTDYVLGNEIEENIEDWCLNDCKDKVNKIVPFINTIDMFKLNGCPRKFYEMYKTTRSQGVLVILRHIKDEKYKVNEFCENECI